MNNTDLSDIVKVTAAMLVKDDKIIIARRGPDDKLADKWEFPGGKIEINETPEQCLKREMKEEFDIDVEAIVYYCECDSTQVEDPVSAGSCGKIGNPEGFKIVLFFLETVFIQWIEICLAVQYHNLSKE
jgi:8-oxo-dGTP pyrophosphatase MutT (NUDIX family)